MLYRLLTDLTVTAHFAFLVFVVAGGFVARRRRWLMGPHLLAAAWGVYVEAMPGLICPLTPLENAFALRAGQAGYQGGFIEHYLVPILYPEGLTRPLQWSLALLLVVVNLTVYAWPWLRRDATLAGRDRGATSVRDRAERPARRVRAAAWFLAICYGVGAPLTAVLELRSHLLSQRFGLPPSLILGVSALQLACAVAIPVRPLAPWAAAGLTLTTLGAIGSHLRIGSPLTALPALVFTIGQVWFGFASLRRGARAAGGSRAV
jgi:Protein of Unknown function (DUF2784)/DoxX-like family